MQHITIVFSERHRVIALPATYEDLIKEGRKAFPYMSSVYSICVLFRPEDMPANSDYWVELGPSAYTVVHNKALLYFNVQHPITKEYILPLPGHGPHLLPNPQKAANGIGRSAVCSAEEDNAAPEYVGVQVSDRMSPAKLNVYEDSTAFVAEVERPDGDACGSGWGVASERFRRSAKLIPNLKECKEAIGLSVGESNGYPDEDDAKDEQATPVINNRGANARDGVSGYSQYINYIVFKRAYDCNFQDCEKKISDEHTNAAHKTPSPLSAWDGHQQGGGWGTFRQAAIATPAPSSSVSQQRGGYAVSPGHSQSFSGNNGWGWGSGAQSLEQSVSRLNVATPAAQTGSMTVDDAVREYNRQGNPHRIWVGSGALDSPAVPGFPPSSRTLQYDHQQNVTGSGVNNHGSGYRMAGTYIGSQNQMGSDVAPDDQQQHAYNGAYVPRYPSNQDEQGYEDQMVPASTWSPERASSEDHGIQVLTMLEPPTAPPSERPSSFAAPARFITTGSPVQSRGKTWTASHWSAKKGGRMTAADNWGAPQGQFEAHNQAAYYHNRDQTQEQQQQQQMAQTGHGGQTYGGQIWGGSTWGGAAGYNADTNRAGTSYAPTWRAPTHGTTAHAVAGRAAHENGAEEDAAYDDDAAAADDDNEDGHAKRETTPRGGGGGSSCADFWYAPNQVTTTGISQPMSKKEARRHLAYDKEADKCRGKQKHERRGHDLTWGGPSSFPKATATGEIETGCPHAYKSSGTHFNHSRRCCIHGTRK